MLSSSVILLAFASIATAFNSTDADYPYTIQAGSVSATVASGWCTAQMNSCYSICGGQAYPNSCTVADLSYNCVCSQITTPNITLYTQTLPAFTCQQYINNCVAATDSAAAQKACMAITCGTLDPTKAATGSSSSSASSSGAASSSASTAGSSSAAAAATSATSAATSAAASATSAAASATSKAGADAAATAGIGMLGAAVAGMIAFIA